MITHSPIIQSVLTRHTKAKVVITKYQNRILILYFRPPGRAQNIYQLLFREAKNDFEQNGRAQKNTKESKTLKLKTLSGRAPHYLHFYFL